MTKDLNEALQNVELTYKDVVDISNDMTQELFEEANRLYKRLDDVNALTMDELRWLMSHFQLEAFNLAEIKEKSALKATLAEALKDEVFAKSFNAAEGAAAVKNNIALIASSQEIITEALYELVASLLKTKVDQCHRAVDLLKSVIMSRMQEAKLDMNARE